MLVGLCTTAFGGETSTFQRLSTPAELAAYRAELAFHRNFVPSAELLAAPQHTNLGEVRTIDFTGHVLTDLSAIDGGGGAILYAPSESDDAAYRAAISAAAGGVVVDYFDTRVATPSVAMLSAYSGVHTWANFAYLSPIDFGNNLAGANIAGTDISLGVFCTYTSGNELSGRIMNARFCPVVSPLGTNHFSSSSYIGDSADCLYTGVTSLTSTYRDFLVAQGAQGMAYGHYADGEICQAARTGGPVTCGEVAYSNGGGAVVLGGTGQWGASVANGTICTHP
jgi:hypothetical protein